MLLTTGISMKARQRGHGPRRASVPWASSVTVKSFAALLGVCVVSRFPCRAAARLALVVDCWLSRAAPWVRVPGRDHGPVWVNGTHALGGRWPLSRRPRMAS